MYKPSRLGSFSLLALACLTIMVGCVIVPSLPTIATELDVGNAASWLVTVPSLGVILFGPLAGRLIERQGSYRSLCFALFSYGLLGWGGSLLSGPLAVFADRLLLGAATAVIMAAGTGLISEFYDGDARLNMIARQGMSIELGGVIFLFVGGVLASIGWRLPFLLYLVAWILLGFVLAFIPNPERSQHLGNIQPEKAAVSAVLKLVFITAVISMTVFFTGIIMLPLRLHELGFTEAQVGYFLSFTSLVAVGAAALMPCAARRLGEHLTLALAFLFYGLSHIVFAVADALPLIIAGVVCLGVGFGLSIPLVNHMTVEQSQTQHRGRNLAYLSMAIFAGQFLSSFMEFLPGGQSLVFVYAAGIAFITIGMILIGSRNVVTPADSNC